MPFLTWLLWLATRRVIPCATFTSDRLAFRRLGRDEVPALCARLTPACLADLCVTDDDLRKPDAFWSDFRHAYAIRRDHEILGVIGFCALGSFGIWIAPEHRGRGYGAETVRAFVTHPHFDRAVQLAGCYEDNIACRRIIEGNNFIEKTRTTIKTKFCAAPRIAVWYTRRPGAEGAASTPEKTRASVG
jgi:GNAT superfamily N-acetyltransferase